MIDKILRKKLIPVAVIHDVNNANRIADALLAADLNVIEVTLRTEAAIECIAAIKESAPEMIIGAGTLLDHKLIPRLLDIGISFAITPGLNPLVIEKAQKHNLLIMPGVITPSEIEQARNSGLEILKFFPAEAAGGASMLKAFAGPYGHTALRFIPTGGINLSNIQSYLNVDCVAAVGGSWFVSDKLVQEGKFDEITRLTREALSIARQ
ncbi:MAG: bifunctional 4-hydroxy-2-oxoglutarate aldolase/2-dehydro-3-deoxy-phosphogluconate aldolase [Gammaproteobacteria bacterium]|nr:bifunctional 4-hydroxy-2-oxoglutarate aldolase/2-dehydro-3-deoxy-phosphogluconate aldolase [Gammaproteobacteria bacterium]